MCGRYAITLPPEAMAQMFSATPGNDVPGGERFNVCPTQQVAICTSEGGSRRIRSARWGFVPSWYKTPSDGPLLINARSETIADKPAFRTAVRERRCLIPMDGFYEWFRTEGQQPVPWYIHRTDQTPLVLAGIWQNWEMGGQSTSSCAIVTVGAGPDVRAIHDREPVSLDPAQWPLWLGESGIGAARLMKPAPAGRLTAYRVATAVNSNRAEGPELRMPQSS